MRLYGAPNDEDEKNSDLLNTVVKSISEGNVVIKEEDISVCHRQGPKVSGKQPILVKFVRRNKRNEVLDKKKELRQRGFSVQEDLTPLRAKLLKTLVNSDLADSVRVSNGKLYAYKKQHDNKYKKIGCVTNPGDLLELGFEFIDYGGLGLARYLIPTEESSVDFDDY